MLIPSTPLLTRLNVRNFSVLNDVSIPLREVNVLVGPNGAGKTTIFDALKFIRDVMEEGASIPVNPWREEDAVVEFSFEFSRLHSGKVFPWLHYSLSRSLKKGVLYEALKTPDGETIFERHEGEMIERGERKPVGEKVPALVCSSAEESSDLRSFIRGWRFYDLGNVSKIRLAMTTEARQYYDEWHSWTLNEDFSNITKFLYQLKVNRPDDYRNLIESTYQGIFRNWGIKLQFKNFGPTEVRFLWSDETSGLVLCPRSLSDGEVRIIALATVLSNTQDMACIDNVDGLGEGVLQFLLKTFCRSHYALGYGIQVIVATHILDTLDEDFLSKVKVIRVEKGPDGYTRVQAIN